MKRGDLEREEIATFYWRYLDLIPESAGLIDTLQKNTDEISNFLQTIPSEKWDYSYDKGKWTILEMIQHIIDTERIFQYRALSIARGEKISLPGFDHDDFVLHSQGNDRKPEDLIEEFKAVRKAGILMFKSFSGEMLSRRGIVIENAATPRAIGFIMPGHALHHKSIINERYL